ncbi:MAG: Rv2231c family pyridoxal phosphate-dependent protein CobC, partial [Mycobacterium sp.]|nr:Rv2231c family pyridoxal phosphate-dependent protein CobC [Mycobacterium sp.]
MPKAGHDAGRGVGQRAVEVEDHQLRRRWISRGVAAGRAICGPGACHEHHCPRWARIGRDGVGVRPPHRPTSVSRMASLHPSPPAADRYHGDQAVAPGMLDFAVNVRHARPPQWLIRRLAARLPDLAQYPSVHDVHLARDAVARRHGRRREEVLPLAGATEGFALLGNLRPSRAAIIAPAFTEPAAALAAARVPVQHVVLEPPFGLEDAQVPEDADLVVVGNPTNPTAVLHPREQLLALRRPGRILVVDEAFADSIPGEPESLAGDSLPDVLVLRSLTKTWALAGLRVGYALGSPRMLARLTAQRAHWPLGTLQLTAIAACCAPEAVAEAAEA